jgi:hypothetical protein
MRATKRQTEAIRAYVEDQAHEAVVHLEKAASELVGPASHEAGRYSLLILASLVLTRCPFALWRTVSPVALDEDVKCFLDRASHDPGAISIVCVVNASPHPSLVGREPVSVVPICKDLSISWAVARKLSAH